MLGFSLNPIDWFTDAAGGIIGGAADAVFNFFLDLVMEALDWLARQRKGAAAAHQGTPVQATPPSQDRPRQVSP